mmetsp:Transcript_81591/g.234449  ORF Transcript_81591/g.234449 Transcript_81591/m.234449 type:complete len:274 (+) Transcript_81591:1396-2217(+)
MSSGVKAGFSNSKSSLRASGLPIRPSVRMWNWPSSVWKCVISSPTSIQGLSPAWSTFWGSALVSSKARTTSTCMRDAATCKAVAPLLSFWFGLARPFNSARTVLTSPASTLSIKDVLPSRPAPFGLARQPLGKLPLWNSPLISCSTPTAVRLPPAIGEAYCCKRTLANMLYLERDAICWARSVPNSLLISRNMMCSTFSLAAHWKRSPKMFSLSMCSRSTSMPSTFCMNAAKRSGAHRPKGIRPLSRCGSAREARSKRMAFATSPPCVVGGAF